MCMCNGRSVTEALRAVPIALRGSIRGLWNIYNDEQKKEVFAELKDAAQSKEDKRAVCWTSFVLQLASFSRALDRFSLLSLLSLFSLFSL